jgi:hypothetical protein
MLAKKGTGKNRSGNSGQNQWDDPQVVVGEQRDGAYDWLFFEMCRSIIRGTKNKKTKH